MENKNQNNVLNNLLSNWSGDELSFYVVFSNLFIGFLLSLLVMFHYRTFSSVLTNKNSISRVFPFITLTTILIISVVKSSLALSLGLVGALSIVRFRTPIKEPEELAYLFISIAIGLGLGANQTLVTIVAAIVILFLMALLKKREDVVEFSKDYYLSIDFDDDSDLKNLLPEVLEVVGNSAAKVDLRRYQVSNNFSSIVLFVDIKNEASLELISQEIRNKFNNASISFIDQSKMPTI
tara:strand:- start:610 stop:1320 length:711 start_codon:yes stop_codon:yes gene_type:complete